MQPLMERSQPSSGRSATPADINRNGRPTSIGTGGRHQSVCPADIIGIRIGLYAQVRYAVQIEGVSRRAAARRFGIDPRTVAKMLAFSVPPGYRRSRPPARPKLDPFTGIIDRILLEDEGRPRKQRHTSKRIFERLRDEYGYSGSPL